MKNKIKTHTTNYFNTFIEVAEDTKAVSGKRPVSKGNKTIAERQYELIADHPYQFTSDEVLFQVYADRNEWMESEYEAERAKFFSRGQACFRTSPLTKNYGFGIHFNERGRIALIGMETEEYHNFLVNKSIKKVKALRSSKNKR